MSRKNTYSIGDNIRAIREFVRNYKRSYVAEKLNITTRAYGNIENNIADITLKRLEEIANILECRPADILTYKRENSPYHPSADSLRELTKLLKLMEELVESQKQRISLLETIIRDHNIDIY